MTTSTAPAPAPTPATPAALATALVLIVHICAQRREYRVTFAPGLDARAAQFINDRLSTCAIFLADPQDGVDPQDLTAWPLVDAALYPECEHGLSLSLCAGPGHYPMDM